MTVDQGQAESRRRRKQAMIALSGPRGLASRCPPELHELFGQLHNLVSDYEAFFDHVVLMMAGMIGLPLQRTDSTERRTPCAGPRHQVDDDSVRSTDAQHATVNAPRILGGRKRRRLRNSRRRGVRNGRRCLTTHNRRRFAHQFVVAKRLHHKRASFMRIRRCEQMAMGGQSRSAHPAFHDRPATRA